MIIEIKNLSFRYPSGVEALKNISFNLEEGGKLGIIGANGAGKSSLLYVLAKLFPQKSLSGSINLNGKEVGLVFQNPDDQIIGSTVEDDVGFSLLKQYRDKTEINGEIKKILEKVHLAGFEQRKPFELSFGEKKRLGIASILISQPEIILLDEPSLGLDARERREIVNILKNFENTLVIASLDLDLIRKLTQIVLVLDKGRLVAQGKTQEILGNTDLLRNCGIE